MSSKKRRAGNHNARKTKHGVITAKHNDRNFDLAKAKHIDASKVCEDIVWHFSENIGEPVEETGWQLLQLPTTREALTVGEGQRTLDDMEHDFYETYLSEALEERNAKYIAQRKKKQVMDIDKYRRNERYCPEETLFTLGDKDSLVESEVLRECFEEFIKWHQREFPQAQLLNAVMHVDEATPHIHWRKVWLSEENGHLIVSQQQALEDMGIEPPKPDKEISRYNNRKMTYTEICRQKQIEIARKHGIDIEEKPLETSKKSKDLAAYQREKDEAAAAAAQVVAAAAQAEADTAKAKQAKAEADTAAAKAEADTAKAEAADEKAKAEGWKQYRDGLTAEVGGLQERAVRLKRTADEEEERHKRILAAIKELCERYGASESIEEKLTPMFDEIDSLKEFKDAAFEILLPDGRTAGEAIIEHLECFDNDNNRHKSTGIDMI